jgi:F420H(2)-dependent biliverdin reductase
MTDLDSVMKKSLAQASSHSREVYGKNPLTAKEVLDLANSSALITAATTRPEGKPHLSPVDLVAVGGTLYLGVDKSTARYKNLIQNPAITVMISEGWKQQAILEGVAHFLEIKSETSAKVLEAEKQKYGWTTEAIAEFSPMKVFTWKAK